MTRTTQRLLFGVVVAVVTTTTGCASIIVESQAQPKRIDVVQDEGEPIVELYADRTAPTKVEIRVIERVERTLTRRVVYLTYESRAEWNPNLLWELLEIPAGAVMIVGAPLMMVYEIPPDVEKRGSSLGFWQFWYIATIATINPFQSVFSARVVHTPIPDRERFFSDPAVTRVAQGFPMRQAEVTWTIEDLAGTVVSRGKGKTDGFGRVVIEGLPTSDLEVHASYSGVELIRTLAGPGLPPTPIDNEPDLDREGPSDVETPGDP